MDKKDGFSRKSGFCRRLGFSIYVGFLKIRDFKNHVIFSIKKILPYVKLNKSTTDRELVFRMYSFQICLCRKRACGLFTENGLCTVCDWCHFFCTEENEFIYDQAVKKFLATKQPQPFCCMTGDLVRTKTKMKAITDPKDGDFGRPYFVCSKKDDPCM